MIFDRELTFYGKYAEIIKSFVKSSNDNGIYLPLFKTNFDIFVVATAIGISHGRYVPTPEKKTNVEQTKIFADMLNKNHETLNDLYVIAILNYNGQDKTIPRFSDEEKIERAFKLPNVSLNDEDTEKKKESESIVYGFALGGLEYIYEWFKNDLEKAGEISDYQLDSSIIQFVQRNIEISPDAIDS